MFCSRLTECLLLLCFCPCVLMSSSYVLSLTGACVVGMSDVYMLNSVGDWTLLCGTPVMK